MMTVEVKKFNTHHISMHHHLSDVITLLFINKCLETNQTLFRGSIMHSITDGFFPYCTHEQNLQYNF
jgi:hypothetical protein